MSEVASRELRNDTAGVLRRVQGGERLTVTLDAVADIELIAVDEAAAQMWARMRVQLAHAGRRVNVNDLWIAASAASRGLPVVTQDDDFAAVAGIAGLEVVCV